MARKNLNIIERFCDINVLPTNFLQISTFRKLYFAVYKLKSGSHLPKKIVLFASLKALKNDENAFYFVLVFVTTFWSFYDCLYFSRCWTIFVLQLFDNKAVTS